MPALVPLPGSERGALPGAQPSGTLNADEEITITLVLRRRAQIPQSLITGPETITPAELAAKYGASPSDVMKVSEAVEHHGLRVTEILPGQRLLKVAGTVSKMEAAFGTKLSQVKSPNPAGSGDVTHRIHTGGLSVPSAAHQIVTAVLGLDTRPQARAQFRVRPQAASSADTSFTAVQVADLYSFPASTDGTGQTIAIIELGGGYTSADMQTYFSGLNLAVPSITDVSVDGGTNTTGSDADGEVELDIQVAGAIAPKAAQKVYFAPNTDQGFIDAISNAVHASPTPTVVSISWGGSEDSWASASMTSMDNAIADGAALGVTVTVAAGDNGSTDGATDNKQHCDFPASSPHALACGGTTLQGSGTTISSEVVWNETSSNEGSTGGGVSDVYALPAWQANAGVPTQSGGSKTGRGVPDVAGNADPVTGYSVVVDGQQTVVGGTSAVAPLWAGLIARLAQSTGKKLGLLQTSLYNGVTAGKAATGFNDITSGNNGAYSAGPGWDACTGLGSPNGASLLTLLQGTGTGTGSGTGSGSGSGSGS